MRFSTRLAKIIFLSTVVVLLGIATMLYIQVNDLIEANESYNHTNEVKLRLEEVLSSLKDAETAQRGYLLTHDSLFLQPYSSAFDKASRAVERLDFLTDDNKEQRSNVRKLDELVQIKFRSFNSAIDSFHRQISDQAKKQILLAEKSLLDSVRRHTNKMEIIEVRLLGQKELEKRKHAFMAPIVVVLLLFIALGVLFLAYYRIIVDLKRSETYLAKLKELNAELIEKNRRLQLTNEELDSFNYISSHDLQEPVRKIRTFISLIEEADFNKLSEKSKYNFHRMQLACIRIQELLYDLISYSQINRQDYKLSEIDLNVVLEKAKLKLEEKIEQTNAVVEHNHLPLIKAIPYQMDQLFEQLISNSIKYRKEAAIPQIKIESSIASQEELKETDGLPAKAYYKIVFSDNGIGFDQQYENKVFELFARLHSNDENTGTGIGLTICKKVVQNHNGLIKVKSKKGEGTTFYIYLPA